jgi:hypothetical protein
MKLNHKEQDHNHKEINNQDHKEKGNVLSLERS